MDRPPVDVCSEFEVEKILIEARNSSVSLLTIPCGSILLMAAGISCTLVVSHPDAKADSSLPPRDVHISTVFSRGSQLTTPAMQAEAAAQKITCSIVVDDGEGSTGLENSSYTLAINCGSVVFIPAHAAVKVTNACESAVVLYRAHTNLQSS